MRRVPKRSAVVLLVAIVCVASAAALSFGQGGGNHPGVIPPYARYKGLTYGEWVAKWQQAALAIPVVGGDHPVFSGGSFGGEQGIRFLAGLTGGVTVDVTIPAGTACSSPSSWWRARTSRRRRSSGPMRPNRRHPSTTSSMTSRVWARRSTAGRSIIAGSVASFRSLVSSCRRQHAGGAGARYRYRRRAGYFLLLASLSVGTHTIHFTATYAPFDYTIDTTYVVTVVPRGRN